MTRKIPTKKRGRTEGFLKALERGLVTNLLDHEKIVTTESKAKKIRPIVEKMITHGKSGTLNSRRITSSYIFDEKVTGKIFDELAKRYADRSGGYTRIIKLELRAGDKAPMVQLELVQ